MIGKLKFQFDVLDDYIKKTNQWSYEHFAEIAGVAPSAISMLKNDKRTPTWELLEQIIQASGIEVSRLVVFDREPVTEKDED